MINFDNIEDLKNWLKHLIDLPVNNNTITELNSIFKFSPEKFATRNNLELIEFTKEFNKYKKIIHNKLLDSKKIKILSKRKIENFIFKYGSESIKTRFCICTKTFKDLSKVKVGKFKFYNTIKYMYIYVESLGFTIFDEKNKRIHMSDSEFNNHFIDIREDIINKILN